MYKPELRFLHRTLEKCRLQVTEVDRCTGAQTGGYRAAGMEDHSRLLLDGIRHMEERVVYRVVDQYDCAYILLRLPGGDSVLIIGPYLTEDADERWIMERAEQLQVPPHRIPFLERYYRSVPVVADQSFLLACVHTFAETLWGGEEDYRVVDLNRELWWIDVSPEKESPPPEELNWSIRQLEERYALENELMQAVSQGLSHKVELMLARLPAAALEHRQTDPVREMRNYCIIINTLLRKAAERGGVHPFHLDGISSLYARRVELLAHAGDGRRLLAEMFREYCRLVSRQSLSRYSQTVQRVMLQIDGDLAGDLSLRTLAAGQNVNASYLSALFRRETGHTLTEYVNQRRVEQALRLLSGTKLQIQTVAQYCGITDVNYFSKVFKRHVGITPREYRAGTVPGSGDPPRR